MFETPTEHSLASCQCLNNDNQVIDIKINVDTRKSLNKVRALLTNYGKALIYYSLSKLLAETSKRLSGYPGKSTGSILTLSGSGIP